MEATSPETTTTVQDQVTTETLGPEKVTLTSEGQATPRRLRSGKLVAITSDSRVPIRNSEPRATLPNPVLTKTREHSNTTTTSTKLKHCKVILTPIGTIPSQVPTKIPEGSKAPVTSKVETPTCKKRKCNVAITLQKVPDKVINQNLRSGKVNSMASEDSIPTKVLESSKVPATSQGEVLGCNRRNHNVALMTLQEILHKAMTQQLGSGKLDSTALQDKVLTNISESSKVPVASLDEAPTHNRQKRKISVTTQNQAPSVNKTAECHCSKVVVVSHDEVSTSNRINHSVPKTSQEVPYKVIINQELKHGQANSVALEDSVLTKISQSMQVPVTSQDEASTHDQRKNKITITAQNQAPPMTKIAEHSKVPVSSQNKIPTSNIKISSYDVTKTLNKLQEVLHNLVVNQQLVSDKVNLMASQDSVQIKITKSSQVPITSQDETPMHNKRKHKITVTAQNKAPPSKKIAECSKVQGTSQDRVPTSNKRSHNVTKTSKEVPQKVMIQKLVNGKVYSMASQDSVPTKTSQSSEVPAGSQDKATTQDWRKRKVTNTTQDQAPPLKKRRDPVSSIPNAKGQGKY